MYKINTSIYNNTKKKDTHNNGNKIHIPNAYPPDIINQDIQKLHILPPHCPLYPNRYTEFFNDNKKLKSMSPYKLVNVIHSKDGKIYQKLEYNNFYTDWKKDALKWYPTGEYENIPSGGIEHKPNILNMKDNNIKLYEQTKKNYEFAKPLATNGINKLNIVFNYKCAGSTFNYQRYASSGINNKEWFNNPLYRENISQETEDLKSKYMNDIVQNSMDLYSSVFEDMYLLEYDPNDAS